MKSWSLVFLLIYVGRGQTQNATSTTKEGEPPALGPGNVLVHDLTPVAPVDAHPHQDSAGNTAINLQDAVIQNDLLAKLGISTGSSVNYNQEFLPTQKNVIGIISNRGLTGSGSVGGHQTAGAQMSSDFILLGGPQNDLILNSQSNQGADALSSAIFHDHPHILASDLPSLAANFQSNQNSNNFPISDSHILTGGGMNGVIGLIDTGNGVNNGANEPFTLTNTNGLIKLNDAYGIMQDPGTNSILELQNGMIPEHGFLDVAGGLDSLFSNGTVNFNGDLLNGPSQGQINLISLNGVGNHLTDLNSVIGLNDLQGAGGFELVRVNGGPIVNLNTGVRAIGQVSNGHQLLLDLGSSQGAVNTVGLNDAFLLNNQDVSGNLISLSDALITNQGLGPNQYINLNSGQESRTADFLNLNNGLGINQEIGLGSIVGLNDAILFNSGIRDPLNILDLNQVPDQTNIVDILEGQRTTDLTTAKVNTSQENTQKAALLKSDKSKTDVKKRQDAIIGNDTLAVTDVVQTLDRSATTMNGPNVVHEVSEPGTTSNDTVFKTTETAINDNSTLGATNLVTENIIDGATGNIIHGTTESMIYGTTESMIQWTTEPMIYGTTETTIHGTTDVLPSTFDAVAQNDIGSTTNVGNNINGVLTIGGLQNVENSLVNSTTEILLQQNAGHLETSSPGAHTEVTLADLFANNKVVKDNLNTTISSVGTGSKPLQNEMNLVSLSELLGLQDIRNNIISINKDNTLSITQNLRQALESIIGSNKTAQSESNQNTQPVIFPSSSRNTTNKHNKTHNVPKIAGLEFIKNSKRIEPVKSEQQTIGHFPNNPESAGPEVNINQPIRVKQRDPVDAINALIGVSGKTNTNIPADMIDNSKNSFQHSKVKNATTILSTLSEILRSNTIMLSEVHDSGTLLRIAPGASSAITMNDLKNAALEKIVQNNSTVDKGKEIHLPVLDGIISVNNAGNMPVETLPTEQHMLQFTTAPFKPTDTTSAIDSIQNDTYGFPSNASFEGQVSRWDSNDTFYETSSNFNQSGGFNNSPYVDAYTSNYYEGNNSFVTESYNTQPLQANSFNVFDTTEIQQSTTTESMLGQTFDQSIAHTEANTFIPGNVNQAGNQLINKQTGRQTDVFTTSSVTGPILNTSMNPTQASVKKESAQIMSKKATVASSDNEPIVEAVLQNMVNSPEANVIVSEALSLPSDVKSTPAGIDTRHVTTPLDASKEGAPFDVNNFVHMPSTVSTANAASEGQITEVQSGKQSLVQNTDHATTNSQTVTATNNQAEMSNIQIDPQTFGSNDATNINPAQSVVDLKSINNDVVNNAIDPKSAGNVDLAIMPDTEVILGEGFDFRSGTEGREMFIIGDGLSVINAANPGGAHDKNITAALDLTDIAQAIPMTADAVNHVNDVHIINDPVASSLAGGSTVLNSQPPQNNSATVSDPHRIGTIRLSGSDVNGNTFILGDSFGILDLVHIQPQPTNNITHLPDPSVQTDTVPSGPIPGIAHAPTYVLTTPSSTGPTVTGSEGQTSVESSTHDTVPPVREIGNKNTINRFSATERNTINGRGSFILSRLVDPSLNNNELILIQNVDNVSNSSANKTKELPDTGLRGLNLTDGLKLTVGEIQSDPVAVTDQFGATNIFSMPPDRINDINSLPFEHGSSLRMPLSPAQMKSPTIDSTGGPNHVILRLSKSIGLGDLFVANDFVASDIGNEITTNSSKNQTLAASTIDFSTQNSRNPTDGFAKSNLSFTDGFSAPLDGMTTDLANHVTMNSVANQSSTGPLALISIDQTSSSPISMSDGFVQASFGKGGTLNLPSKNTFIAQDPRSTNISSARRIGGRRLIIPPVSSSSTSATAGPMQSSGTSGDGARILELPSRSADGRPVLALFSRRGSSPRRSLILLRRPQTPGSTGSPDRRLPSASSERSADGGRIRFSGTPLLDRLAQRPRGDVSRYLVPPRFIRPPRGSIPGGIRRILRFPERGRLSRSRRPPRIATLRRPPIGRSLIGSGLPPRDVVGVSSSGSIDTVSPLTSRSLRGSTAPLPDESLRPFQSRIRARARPLRSRRPPPVVPPLIGPADVPPSPFLPF